MKVSYKIMGGVIGALAIILLFGLVGGAQGAGMRGGGEPEAVAQAQGEATTRGEATQGEATSPVRVDHTSVALYATIPAEYLTAAQDVTLFYNDRSVGWNLDIALSRFGLDRSGITFFDNDSVEGTALGYAGQDAFAYFPSYLDYRYAGNVATDFQPLRDMQAANGKQLTAWTTSLARGGPEDLGNRERIRSMNDEIRVWGADLPLFDVADILSHTPEGAACFDNWDGVPSCNASGTKCEDFPDDGLDTPAICPAYTDEVYGGHLNNAGGERLAKALWVFLAQLAGWQPEPIIIETPTPAPPTVTPTAIPPDADICRQTVDLSGYPVAPLERNPFMELRAYGADYAPRDAAGNPAPGGKLGAVVIGHSITQQICSDFKRTLYAPGEPSLVWICGAQAGEGTADHWAQADNAVWDELAVRMAAADLTDAQVQVAIVKLAYIGAVKPGDEQAYVERLAGDILATQLNLEARFPNLQVTYIAPLVARHTQATELVTSNEPAGYLSRLAVQQAIDTYFDQTIGIKSLLNGPDLWAADWPADRYRGDCVHLTDAGNHYAAEQWQRWLRYDDTAFWYNGLGAVQPPTVTPEPTVEPTVTSVPPTVTTEPTLPPTVAPTVAPPTVAPPPTSTPAPGNGAACLDHDMLAWHTVYDAERNCYYDHFHGDNPHDLDGVFGTEFRNAVLWPGSDVSPLSDPLTNDYDHHVGLVWLNKLGGCDLSNSAGCITEARTAVHHFPDPADLGATTPGWHTGYIEARLCYPQADGTQRCGFFRTLGLQTTGDIYVDGVLAVDAPEPREVYTDPLTGLPAKTAKPLALVGCATGRGYQTWYATSLANWRVATLQNDVWADGCGFIGQPSAPVGDGSIYELHTTGVDFLSTRRKIFDADNDGIINWRGYVNPKGLIDVNCTSISAQCLPLWIDGVPWPATKGGSSGYQGIGNGPAGRVEVEYNPTGAPLYNPFAAEVEAPACAVDQEQGQPIDSSTHFGLWAGIDSIAQTFQPSADGELCAATLSMYDVRTNSVAAPASAYVEVWSDGGGQPGTLLATSENAVLATDLTGMCEPLAYTFAPGVQLVAGNTYWLLAKSDLNYEDWFFDACWTSGAEDLYLGGAFWTHSADGWTALTHPTGGYVDAAFSVSSR